MAIKDGGFAPYAPFGTVATVLDQFREKGSPSPITLDGLVKLGIQGSLGSRVIATLKALELIDKEGQPTETFLVLRKVPTDQYPERFGDVVRAAYADVFKFVDPAKDDILKVKDAFRGFTPEAQRDRMVMLFVGLCKYAGIVKGAIREASGTRESIPVRNRPRTPKAPTHTERVNTRQTANGDIPPQVMGVVAGLPFSRGTWTSKQRDAFLAAFAAVVDTAISIDENQKKAEELEGEGD